MKPEEVRFHILERVRQQPELSQRNLPRELGVSLGKINHCLRALITKGYIKAGNFARFEHKAAYLQVLTPSGVDAKLRLTRAFLGIKQREYELLKQEISDLRAKLVEAEELL